MSTSENAGPAKLESPGNSGSLGVLSCPTALTTAWAVNVSRSPDALSMATRQRSVVWSKTTSFTS